jgi:hypothetical protein
MGAIFEDVLCALTTCPPARTLQVWWERKQKLVSEVSALRMKDQNTFSRSACFWFGSRESKLEPDRICSVSAIALGGWGICLGDDSF